MRIEIQGRTIFLKIKLYYYGVFIRHLYNIYYIYNIMRHISYQSTNFYFKFKFF